MLKKFLYYLSLLTGFLLFVAIFILNRLAYKKGGLNHHLLYRKNQYLKGIFSLPKLIIFSIGFTLIALIMLYLIFKTGNIQQKIAKSVTLFYCIAFILCSNLESVRRLIVYPYILFGILLSFCASLAAIYLASKNHTF